jgi:hypothetical protein
MVNTHLLPFLVFTMVAFITCPILAGVLTYYQLDSKRRSRHQRILVPVANFILVSGIMLVLQRQYPFDIQPLFLFLFVVLSIATIAEYRKRRKRRSGAQGETHSSE